MDRQLRTFIMLAIGILTFSAICYIAVFLPSENRETRDQQTGIEEANRNEQSRTLPACLEGTYGAYSQKWNRYCRIFGKNPDCTLPSFVAARLDASYEDDRRDCLKLYQLSLLPPRCKSGSNSAFDGK